MEAKDTVKLCPTTIIGQRINCIPQCHQSQAEISFKAGMEEEAKGGTNAISYLTGLQDGEKKGMQKVVGFIGNNSAKIWDDIDDARIVVAYEIPKEKFQAFLKENGLEG